jgi:hypothetical protein
VEFPDGVQNTQQISLQENLFFAVGFRRKSICDIKEICDHKKDGRAILKEDRFQQVEWK